MDKSANNTAHATINRNGAGVDVKKVVLFMGMFMLALGLAAQTDEILGCFTLPADGFLYLFGTTSHKLFLPIMSASWPLMIAGATLIAAAMLIFPSIPKSRSYKAVRFHKFGVWKSRRFKFAVIIFMAIALHSFLVNENIVSLASFCPLSFAEQASVGKWGFSAIFFGIVFLTILIFGRSLCSWMCVYGPIQEHTAGLLKVVGINPNKKKKNFGKFRLIHLITAVFWVSLAVATVRYFNVLSFEPLRGYRLGETWVFVGAVITFIPLTLLMTYLFGNRFYCRNLCPIGGAMGLYSRFGLLKVRVNNETCDGCGICQEVCPMNVPLDKKAVATTLESISDGRCIQCGECVDQCPTNSLRLGFVPNRSMDAVVDGDAQPESA